MKKLFYILRFIEAMIAIFGILILSGDASPTQDIYYVFMIKVFVFVLMCFGVFIFDTIANKIKYKYKIYDLE